MKKKTMIKKAAVLGMMICLAMGLSACGGSDRENETTTTADASEETTSSLPGKYLPYSADYAGINMSYTDLEEADMVANNYLVINDDETSGEFGLGEDTASQIEIDATNGTITVDGITIDFEVQADGSLKINMTAGEGEEALYMYYAKEGEAYEKAKEESEANSTFAEWSEEADPEETEQTEENTDTAEAVEDTTDATAQEEDPGVVLEGVPSGDGVTDKQTVLDTYDQISNSDDKFDLTYEMVKDMIGTDGELDAKESSAEKHYYVWYGEGSNVILTVVFKGNETDGYTLNSYAIAGE